MRLTLRTLLAYLDDTLDPAEAKIIGQKLSENPSALELVERIRKVTRRRGLSTPPTAEQGSPSDPNTVAAYLSDALGADQLAEFEETCLASDVHLAEVAACHQILTLVLTEQMTVPPTAVQRMYGLVKGRESIPSRKSGKSIPVGGLPSDPKAAFDDSDAPYLLGMSAYSHSQPIALRILKWAAVAALIFGFGIASFMAWPRTRTRTAPTDDLAAVVPTTKASEPTKPETTPPTTPVKPMPDPVDPPIKPMPDPVEPMPVDPGPPAEPMVGRIAVAKLEAVDEHVLVAKGGAEKEWVRVASGADIQSSDRLVCLPGYRAKLKCDGGLTAELWGNLPELLPFPLLETSLTLHIAPKGYDAEMTLHVGRVYFNTNKADGAKIRVRFAKEIWDIALPDAKSEAVLELSNEPVPGRTKEAPRSLAVLSTISGSTKVTIRKKEQPPIPSKQILLWTSKSKAPDGPRAPDPKLREPDFAYFDRFAVLPNESVAKPTRAALDKFAKGLRPGKSILAALTETQQVDKSMLSDETVFGSRFALYAFASLGELTRVIDAVNDPERPFCRMAALKAIRSALATKPELEETIVKLAADKLRMETAVAEKWVLRLRGLTDAERIDPAVIDALVEGLSASEIAERELNFFLLSHFVDPLSLTSKELMSFDSGAESGRREEIVRLWKRRAEMIKAVLKNMPPK